MKSLKFYQTFQFDAEFADWILDLPCLDQDDTRTARAEIRNNPRLAKVLLIVTCISCVLGFAYPRPYELLIFTLAVQPWLALAIVHKSHGLFRIDENRNDAHPSVAITLIFPALILFLRSTDFQIIYSGAIAWPSIAVGILLLLGAIKADQTFRTRPGSLIALLIFFIVYGYGVVIEANVLCDQTAGVTYAAPVEERHVVRGKRTTYKVTVGPWGPRTKPNDIRVGRQTYDYIRPGNVMRIVLKKGALGFQWYYMLSWS